MTRFDEARQLTREVRLMFPFNQEAGLLDLRIEQFIDPVIFNAGFEQRLNNARAGTRQQSIVAFADLLALAEINPNYPNIRGIIVQAEIDMGIRLPAPNPADITQSRDLTAAARRIVDANLVAQYDVARAQLDQAIRLNPNNTEALQVRDILLQRMRLPGAIVLTSEDELLFSEAERHHLAGNNLAAYTILQRLMGNPQNRNVEKLARLYDRVRPLVL
jgi:tetratricopeptide (TPR) repeat protein